MHDSRWVDHANLVPNMKLPRSAMFKHLHSLQSVFKQISDNRVIKADWIESSLLFFYDNVERESFSHPRSLKRNFKDKTLSLNTSRRSEYLSNYQRNYKTTRKIKINRESASPNKTVDNWHPFKGRR